MEEAKVILEGKYGFSLSTVQVEESSLNEKDPKEIEFQNKGKVG
jgi:hypothetical protein